MLYLGIDQHARQITISLRDENGDVVQARQVSTEPKKIHAFFQQLTRRHLSKGESFVAITLAVQDNIALWTARSGKCGEAFELFSKLLPVVEQYLGPNHPMTLRPPLERAISREQAAALEQALRRLSPEHQQVLTMRYEGGRSFADIGSALGRSEEAANKLWMRAVRRWREEMRSLHESNGLLDAWESRGVPLSSLRCGNVPAFIATVCGKQRSVT